MDSADEDKPTRVDFSTDDRRLMCRLEIRMPEFPLAIRIEYIGKLRRCVNWRADRRHEPGDAPQHARRRDTQISPHCDHHAHANRIVKVRVRGDR